MQVIYKPYINFNMPILLLPPKHDYDLERTFIDENKPFTIKHDHNNLYCRKSKIHHEIKNQYHLMD